MPSKVDQVYQVVQNSEAVEPKERGSRPPKRKANTWSTTKGPVSFKYRLNYVCFMLYRLLFTASSSKALTSYSSRFSVLRYLLVNFRYKAV
ncbi:hypothetical protein BpHYR1_008054 [Brachionus plicatilis]|uniref:Uncharacterized protein n=1 Tax=Brachionus plicatilis TaxID=10195 RepID=A0A3M7T3A3_BRAPC|nr:hypothetical protein BpHYR1_008054 [Brachionus plicatilis]